MANTPLDLINYFTWSCSFHSFNCSCILCSRKKLLIHLYAVSFFPFLTECKASTTEVSKHRRIEHILVIYIIFIVLLCFFFSLRIVEGRNTSYLEKLEHGYENMDHFTVSFEHEKKAILNIDFTRGNYVTVHYL